MISRPEASARDVIDAVLDLVRDRHLEPDRIDPAAMWRAAHAAHARLEGTGDRRHDGAAERAGAELAPGDLAGLGDRLRAIVPDRDGATAGPWLAATLGAALRTLDRWSTAATGSQRARIQDRYTGATAGIGARIGRRDGSIRVLAVDPRGGAMAAGLQAADDLVAIDGAFLDGLVVAEVLRRLRGPAGTSVRVGVRRRGAALAVDVVRRPLPPAELRAEALDEGLAALRIAHFSRGVAPRIANALQRADGDAPVRGLVIDLRGNQGGSMLACAETADLFIDDGLLVQTIGRDGRPAPDLRAAVHATPGGRTELPLAIVVDARTASSAELFAATMSRRGRARLFGQRTFGKTTIQKMYDFPNVDLIVKLTSAEMWAAGGPLPSGGLRPDTVIEDGDPVRAAARMLLGRGRCG